MPFSLLLIAEIDEADHDDDARARLDAFREAVRPSAEWGITLHRPTAEDLERLGYAERKEPAKSAPSQEAADAIALLLEGSWGDEIEDYNEQGRPAGHNFEGLVVLENLLMGTGKTAAEFADEALEED